MEQPICGCMKGGQNRKSKVSEKRMTINNIFHGLFITVAVTGLMNSQCESPWTGASAKCPKCKILHTRMSSGLGLVTLSSISDLKSLNWLLVRVLRLCSCPAEGAGVS